MGVLGDPSAPAFQDALRTQVLARGTLPAGTSVVIGPPSPGVAQTLQWIAFLEIDGLEKWAAMGRLQKEEDYRQKMYISVMTRDGEGDSARGRDVAYALRKEIADQLLEDPTVNGTVWQAQIDKSQRFEPRLGISTAGADGQHTVDMSWREAALFFDILVKNRF